MIIARPFIFLTAFLSIPTIVAGNEYDAEKRYRRLASKARKAVEECAQSAIEAHNEAARRHAKINHPSHQEASEAHAREGELFVTKLERHRRMVRQYYPPDNNKGFFDWHVMCEQRAEEYCASHDNALWANNHLKSAEEALSRNRPVLAATFRREALKYQPGRLACGVDPFKLEGIRATASGKHVST